MLHVSLVRSISARARGAYFKRSRRRYVKRWTVARSDEAFAAALDEPRWTGQEGGGQEGGNSAAKFPDRACLRLNLAEALLHCRRSCVGRKMPVGNTGESRQDNDQHSFLRKPCKAYRPEEAENEMKRGGAHASACLLYTSPSPRDRTRSRMPSSA